MNPGTLDSGHMVMFLLLLGAVLALGRHAIRIRREHASAPGRAFGWIAILAVLQIICCTLLWFTLFPPTTRIAVETLVVLTARAQHEAQSSNTGRIIALPEAGARAGVERAADLATALRRYPDTRRVRVFGEGLTARDRDAVRDVVVEFMPAIVPMGLVELDAPAQVAQGARWQVHGRVAGLETAVAQLRDPAGAVLARAPVGADGRFTLAAIARAPGHADYRLRVLNQGRSVHRDTVVPLQVTKGDRLRVLLLAGAPGPELKYLRRWATDAGLDVRSEITLGASTRLSATAAPSERRRFADADLVVLDDRAWRALGDAGEDELLQAARAGAGVLLRVTSAFSVDDRVRLRRWGFEAAVAGQRVAGARQESVPNPVEPEPLGPPLQTRPPGIEAPDGIALRDTRDATVLGLYRREGSGRLGVWWAVDTYRRVLAGAASEHGALWSHTVAELARPAANSEAPRWMAASMRVGERQTVCGIDAKADVLAPDGRAFALMSTSPPAAAANRTCAGFWPRTRGWHKLRVGATSWPLHVRSADATPGLRAYATREATLQLAALPAPLVRTVAASHPQARWPWFLAWLAAAAVLWRLERASTRYSGVIGRPT